MSVLVVGLSHKSAPIATLERVAVSGDTLTKLLRDLAQAEPVAEAFVISTCNRVEVYADVDRFHAGVTAICELLARHCGAPSPELTPHLYVHYEERAISHLLAVAAGLDSMVVGEDQILGQVRSAVKLAEEHGTAGRVLGELGRLALRTGKRARAETTIGRAGLSLLSAAVEVAAGRAETDTLSGRRVLVVGAGSMSALAAATAARSGAASIAVANRTKEHAERVAASVGTAASTITGLDGLPAALAAADVVISCTGATGQVITLDVVTAALAARSGSDPRGPLVIMDLAMPRDVEPGVADLPGVVLIGMDQLREHAGAIRDDDVAAVRAILEAELASYQSAMDAARVAPVVVALRAKAAKVVDAELTRLSGRLSADDLSGHALDEIAQTVRRVVDKLLHAPTVRVKELAGSPGGEEYAAALRVLFDLDPRAVEAVTRAAPEQEGSR
ncbi:MAG TPA: glutamyl-tRNA reductase [Streptosporangiaceae bacterium]|nr:glutamyl-tRNA reductase [Streptosporangiaceae bacterium]